MRMLKKRKVKYSSTKTYSYCTYHPQRPAVSGVQKDGEILFWICQECKNNFTKKKAEA